MVNIATAAQAYSSCVETQHAFNAISFINFMSFYTPFSDCVQNLSAFDYIIVGGGTSGCVLGSRLSEDPNVKVMVIEAGGDFPIESEIPSLVLYTKQSRFDWNQTLPSQLLEQCHQSSEFTPTTGQLLGGSSSVDFMLYSQGYDRDYNKWATITDEPSWNYENVLRLFKKVERFNDNILKNSPDSNYYGFDGKVGLSKDRSASIKKYFEAFQEVGYPIVPEINNKTKLGFAGAVYYIDENIRQNSAYAYLHTARKRTNLVVLKYTQVTKILFDKNKKTVGVEAVMLNSKETFVFKVGREVIVTAGVFNTVKLLQLSGIGPAKILHKHNIPVICDLPVGFNYQDHIAVPIVYATEKTCKKYVQEKHNIYKYQAPSFVGYVSLNKSNPYPEYRSVSYIITHTPAAILLQYTAFIWRYKYDICDYWYRNTIGRELVYSIIENLKPESRGRVQISSKDPFDSLTIEPGYFSKDVDVQDLIEYVRDFLRVLKSSYFKKVGAFFVDPLKGKCGKYDGNSDEYWRCYVKCLIAPVSHHSGTTALGKVVDGRLRVYGVEGLRVADAGIIPELIPGSVTIPTMMIGENAAEMIKADWNEK